jgi:CheY-like chemotaxis protein
VFDTSVKTAPPAVRTADPLADRLAANGDADRPGTWKPGVLVVDDERIVRTVLSASLQQDGFAVWQAASGAEACEVYRREGKNIALVLLDLHMPGLSGPQTLHQLQQIDAGVCCCFMSGNIGNYTEEGLRQLGALAVIPKPFRLDEVAQLLWQVVGGSGRWKS